MLEREIILAGGTGGLGRVTAQKLAAEGAKVIVGYNRNAEAARELGAAVQADITKPEDRTRLLDAAPGLYGLVIFTGIAARAASDWDESLRVNYTGPILLAREAAARMKVTGCGSIVLIATMQTVGLFPGSSIYAGAKAALVHAARILAKENRGPGEVRVNIVSPGVMNAGMAAVSIASGKYDRWLEEGSIPRWGRAEDVARAVRFFLEPDNYITGQHLLVDGGLNL
jgi:NAD(P)-dependent dehydrogenase (short-subunit alcohol dehydrogenase family)